MPDQSESPYHAIPPDEGPLRQCELLSNLVEVVAADHPRDGEGVPVELHVHPYAIVIAQDCDLDKDWQLREACQVADYGRLRNVLMCEVSSALVVRNDGKNPGSGMPPITSNIWTTVRQNRDERFHFLERIPEAADSAGIGIEELVVHFRRVFTVEADRIYGQVARGEAARRCRLRSPYLEHLANRFTGYWCRVALPGPHRSE